MRRFSKLCLALIALLLLGLTLSHKTGWLVRQQAQAVFGGQGVALVESLKGPKTPPTLSERGEVARKLRTLCEETLVLQRDAEEQFLSPYHTASKAPVSPDFSLYEVLELTGQGMRLDPDNAFFPAIRAVALLTIQSDDTALVALHQAAQCSRWNDYSQEEIRSRFVQLDQVQGKHTALTEIQVEQSFSASHLGRLKALARVVTALAAKREQAGALTEGLTLRHDLRALGVLLREQPGLPLTSHIGIALITISTARPGGEAPRVFTGSMEENKQARQRDILVAHTLYWGESEASAVARLLKRNDEIKSLHEKMTYASDNFFGLALQWQTGLLLLAMSFTTVLVGALCGLLVRLHGAKPASPGVRFGLWCLLSILVLVLGGLYLPEGWQRVAKPSALALYALATALFFRTLHRGNFWSEWGRCALTLLLIGQVFLLAVLAMWGVEDTRDAFYDSYLRCCFSAVSGDPIPWWETLWDAGMLRVYWAAPNLVPLMALVPLWALVSQRKRVPVVYGTLRGLGYCALPMVLLLTALYAVQVHKTVQQEARLKGELRMFYKAP